MRHHPQRTNRHRNINASSVLCYRDTTPRPTLFFCGGRIPVGGTLYTPCPSPIIFARSRHPRHERRKRALLHSRLLHQRKDFARFSYAFRYDHIADLGQNSGDTQAIVPDQYGLIMDYHLYLSYHFQLFQKQAFFVQLGISRLNNAPIIRKTPRSIVSGSTSRADNLSLDPRDSATRFALGIEKKKFNVIGGLYYSKENPFYDAGSYIVPYFQFNYRLGK